jgi:hypothetical protein
MERQHGQASCQRPPPEFSANLIHDFSGQLSIRIRGKISEDAGGANTCVGSPIDGRAGVGGISQTL